MKTSVGYVTHRRARRRIRWWVLSAGVGLGLLWWWQEREPRYQGRSLSAWLDNYDAIMSGRLTEPGFEQTREALRQLGRNGLSCYTARLAYTPPDWQRSVLGWLDRLPPPLQKMGAKISSAGNDSIEARVRRAQAAVTAFEFLGSNAAAAVPDLEHLALSSPYFGTRESARRALSYLGSDGVVALARVVVKGDEGSSVEALWLISELGANTGRVKVLLTGALGTNFCANPQKYHDFVLDALDKSARYSNAVVRRKALKSLVAFPDSFPYDLLTATDPAVRADVTNALRELRPGDVYPNAQASRSFQVYSRGRLVVPGNVDP